MWKYFPRNTVILQRGSFQNGYQCYVYCVVQKDGNEVRIGSIDGEADYYPLSTAWMISSIFRKFFKLNAELYANTDAADADLNDLLSQLQYLRQIKKSIHDGDNRGRLQTIVLILFLATVEKLFHLH